MSKLLKGKEKDIPPAKIEYNGSGVYQNLNKDTLECLDNTAVLRNRSRVGFSTPREEFVESIKYVSPEDLAKKWRLDPAVIQQVHDNRNWKTERIRFLLEVKEMEKRISERDTSDLRLLNVTKDVRLWGSLKSLLISVAEKGATEEMSPMGDKWNRAFGPKELHDLTRAAEIIGKNMDTQFKIIRGDDEEVDDAIIPRSIRVVVYNSPDSAPEGPEDPKELEEERMKSLPESVSTVEGEIVDGTV